MAKRKAQSKAAPQDQGPTFEALLERLERTVERLEGGDLSLDQALAAYEEGVALAAQSEQLLDAAEQRIQELRDAED